MINIIAIQSILQSFVSDISDIQGATLVSPDGLAIASALPERVDEERIAAMTAAMLSIGERIGRELARGQIDRVIVVGEKGYSVLVNCSDDAVLLILANANAKQGLLFLEIKRAVAELVPLLAEQPKANLLT
ncbi:MAG: diacylglyceryl transferase [Leptolyngbyaceae cyanobacterium CSU_1_3]|nr:diacylglyceryl transferase [Leptolyngbyaceae cyanobacterium CSU_1_3]